MPEWLEQKIKQSKYQQVGEVYYRGRHPTNSLYVEVMKDGYVSFYDGWNYKRGLKNGESGLEQAEFARIEIDRDRWRVELACAVCFARRTRKQYGWNVIPVFEGMELKVR